MKEDVTDRLTATSSSESSKRWMTSQTLTVWISVKAGSFGSCGEEETSCHLSSDLNSSDPVGPEQQLVW